MSDEGAAQRRLTEAVEKLQGNLSKSHYRPMMKKVYTCSLSCYDNPSLSDDQVSQCEQNCAASTQAYGQIFQHEMNAFQERLRRGVADCQDSASDRVTESVRKDPNKMNTIQADMMKCVSVCVDKHIAMLPGLQKKIESQLDAAFKS